MGPPSQTLELPQGEKALYFSRLPEGRMVFVATINSDGILRTLDQRLTRQNIARLQVGTSTKNDVLGFFGPPGNAGRYPRLEREWWEYKFFDYQDRRILTVQFSDDGIVREVLDMRDWAFEPPGPGRSGKGHH